MSVAYIYDFVRTPRGKGKKDGTLHEVPPHHLLAGVLKALRDRNDFDITLVEDVIMGCVTQAMEQGSNIAKAAVMYADYPDSVAAVTINRFCASGLEAVNQMAAYVMSGQVQAGIAGGVESMSRVPMGSDGGALFMAPDLVAGKKVVPQGISADLIATKFSYDRTTLDAFAVQSHQRAAKAWAEGRFAKSVVPVKDVNGIVILERDETIRANSSVESMASLAPAFEQMGQMGGFDALAIQKYPEIEYIKHVHHAGNSSGIVDGSAGILIGSKEFSEKTGLKPRALIKAFAVTGTEPTIMLEGPAPATRKALAKAGMNIGDIDLFEVNEAFAVVAMRFIDIFGLDTTKVNVNGGAIAMGHPLGATGAIILGTVLDELERQNKTTGLATLCVGGGMGIATIIERV